MNMTMMIFLQDFGPKTPRPADPSPEGGQGEPVGDDDDEADEDAEPDEHVDRAGVRGGAI